MSWEFEILEQGYNLSEGPAWDGKSLLFTDINNSRIMRYDPDTAESTVFHDDTARTNGLMIAEDGRLYGCSQNRRSVVRFEIDGEVTVLAGEFEGKQLNSPNDLAIDKSGRIWFTDPRYDDLTPPEELDHRSVYRLDPCDNDDWSITRVTYDTTRPNGILVSLDQSELFVSNAGRDPDEPKELRSYPIRRDGSLGQHRVVHNFFPYRAIDGMCWDSEGNIIATSGRRSSGPGPMIYVIEQSGRIVETHPLPVDNPTNCTFAGPELTDLYVTSIGGDLLRAHTDRQGVAF